MIGRLQGTLLEKSSFNVLLDVGGVGYELEVPSSTLSCLPALGAEVILYTHLVVREDAHLLYAFTQKLERDLFRDLLRLNGVGPKLALALISVGLEALVHAVQQQSTKALMSIPGVGKKTAERLLVELKDRLKGWEMNLSAASLPLLSGQPLPMGNTGVAATAEADAISALQALGFKPQEAIKAVRAVYAPSLSAEDLIRLALKGMHS